MSISSDRTLLISATVIALISYFISFIIFFVLVPHRHKQRQILFDNTSIYFEHLLNNWVWILIGTTLLAWILSIFTHSKIIGYLPFIGPALLVVITLTLIFANK